MTGLLGERPTHPTLDLRVAETESTLALRQRVHLRLHRCIGVGHGLEFDEHGRTLGLLGAHVVHECLAGLLCRTYLADDGPTEPSDPHEDEAGQRQAEEHPVHVEDGVEQVPGDDAVSRLARAVMLHEHEVDGRPCDERATDEDYRIDRPVEPRLRASTVVVYPDGSTAVVGARRCVEVERLQPVPVDVPHTPEEVGSHRDQANGDANHDEQRQENQAADDQSAPEVALVVRLALVEHADESPLPAWRIGREHLAVDDDILNGSRVDVQDAFASELV